MIEILASNVRGESHIIIQPVATAINGLFWSLYAYGKKDYFLFIPNATALVLGILIAISALV